MIPVDFAVLGIIILGLQAVVLWSVSGQKGRGRRSR